MQETYCHISDRLECIAPLGRDSVPEVYISRSGSSSSTATSGGCVVLEPLPYVVQPSARRRRAGSPPTLGQPPAAPIAFCAVSTSAASTTNAVAPLWSRM